MSSQIIHRNRKLIFVTSFVCCLIGCNGLDLKCQIGDTPHNGKQCTISATSTVIKIRSPNQIVTTINGQPSSYWKNQGVKSFEIYRKTVNYMPKDIDKFFPEITNLMITDSNLKVIEKHNLQPFVQLHSLYLHFNLLETLSSDLFDHNPLMRTIVFSNNPLKSVGANIFTKLKSLNWVNFARCDCINDEASKSENIPAFIKKLRQQCSNAKELQENCSADFEKCETDVQGLKEEMQAAEANHLSATKKQEEVIQRLQESLRTADEKLKAAEATGAKLLSTVNQQEKTIQGLNKKLRAAEVTEAKHLSTINQQEKTIQGLNEKLRAAEVTEAEHPTITQQEMTIQGLNEKLRAAEATEAKHLSTINQQEKTIQGLNEKLRAAEVTEAKLLSSINQQEKTMQGLNEKLRAAEAAEANHILIANKYEEVVKQLNQKMKVVNDNLNTAIMNLFLIKNKLPVEDQLSVDLTCKVDHETCDVIDLKVKFAKTTIGRVKYENLESFDKSSLRSLRISNKQTLFLPINLADHFPELTEISVTESGLFDIEPEAFKSLDKLIKLSLIENKLMKLSSKSFKDLENLLILVLSLNQIRFMDDSAFDGLVKLEVLKLNGNFLKSIDNQVFAGLDSLKELDLHDNELKFITPNIQKDHSKMSSLNLAGNECINMSFPIETQAQIEKEIIENCIAPVQLKCIFDEEGNFIGETTSITGYMCIADGFHVEYPQTKISSVSGEHAANHDVDKVKVFMALGQSVAFMPMKLASSLPKLEKILIERSKLTSIQRLDFEGMVGVRWISLSSNELAAIGDETFDDLAALEYLNLAQNRIATLPSKAFANLTKLAILILSNNQLVNLSADIMPRRSIIEKFQVDHNKLEFIDPKVFKALRKANLIDFTSNECVNMKHDKSVIVGKTLADLHSEVDFNCDLD